MKIIMTAVAAALVSSCLAAKTAMNFCSCRATSLAILAAITFHASVAWAQVIVVPVEIYPFSKPADHTVRQSVHRIAIISIVGERYKLQNSHLLGSDAMKWVSMADEKLDDGIVGLLTKYFSSQYEVGTVPYDRPAMLDAPDRRQAIKAIHMDSEHPVDAIVLVRPGRQVNGRGIEGLGYEQNTSGPGSLWANYEIDVLDARDGDLLAQAFSRVAPSGFPQFLMDRMSSAITLTDDLSLPDTALTEIRLRVSKMLVATLGPTIRALNMVITVNGHSNLARLAPENDPFRNMKRVMVYPMLGTDVHVESIDANGQRSATAYQEAKMDLDRDLRLELKNWLSNRFDTVYDPRPEYVASSRKPPGQQKDSPDLIPAGLKRDSLLDAYVIVERSPPAAADDREQSGGVGLFSRQVDGKQTADAFLNYRIVVIDSKTLQVIASRDASRLNGALPHYAFKAGFSSLPLTDKQQEELASDAHTLIFQTLGETLLQLKLLGVADGTQP